MIKLFGIPNCDTVKKARLFFNEASQDVEFVDFKKSPPIASDIERWSKFMGGLPVNNKGTTYKKFKDVFEPLSEKEKIKFIIRNPSMIKRPIVEKNGVVVCMGFDEAIYKKTFK